MADFDIEGFWLEGDWIDWDEASSVVDLDDLYAFADAIVIHIDGDGIDDVYITIHGADDLDTLEDLVDEALEEGDYGG